jgi:pimeloyl-ACP methyl ester carboxylesterase
MNRYAGNVIMKTPAQLTIDDTTTLDIDGTRQRVRRSAERRGQPPLLIVQGGPALPLRHEVDKFRRRLNFERDFLVAYWDQRGCGDAPAADARGVSMARQVDDLRAVIRWLHGETGRPVLLLGISIGGTWALQAAASEPERVQAIIAISPDARTVDSDATAEAFLLAQAGRAASGRLGRRVRAVGRPPYVDPGPFQRRARLLADLGTIERGMTFSGLVREFFPALLRTYGIAGTMRTLRNMNLVQRRLLPEIAALDLLASPPRVTRPVHYLFGEQDALTPTALIDALPAAVAAPGSTVRRVADAGHMVHFDQPAIVRAVVERAARDAMGA